MACDFAAQLLCNEIRSAMADEVAREQAAFDAALGRIRQ
jgi:hypothetical protein